MMRSRCGRELEAGDGPGSVPAIRPTHPSDQALARDAASSDQRQQLLAGMRPGLMPPGMTNQVVVHAEEMARAPD